MTAQTEALPLANLLDNEVTPEGIEREAALELRRLHEAHDWQYKMAGERLRRIEKLERQRDALLGALKEAVDVCGWPSPEFFYKALAAIAKAEES